MNFDFEYKNYWIEYTVSRYRGDEPGMGWYVELEDYAVFNQDHEDITDSMNDDMHDEIQKAIDDDLCKHDLDEDPDIDYYVKAAKEE